MHFAISFKSAMFDVSKENENPINPIYGESLLIWLKDQLSGGYDISSPDAEDWGWYSYVNCDGRQYILGASSYFEEVDDPKAELEWILQIDKQRSFKEKLLGREKMTKSDPCLQLLKIKLESEVGINSIEFA